MKSYKPVYNRAGNRTSTNRFVPKPPKKKYSEVAVDRALKKAIEDYGGITFKNHPLTNAGIPDRIVHIDGRTFYVELKATGACCTPLQIAFHNKLYAKGIHTYVLDTKIEDYADLYMLCYTVYDSKYYRRNPHQNLDQNENI